MTSDTPIKAHPREALAERNLTAILDAAERLIRRGDQVSIAAVATAAGVSRPTVYAHFRAREQLLEGVVTRAVGDAMSVLEQSQPDAGPGNAAFERIVAEGWEQLARHEAIASVAAGDLSARALRRAHANAHSAIATVIERGHADGTISTDLPTDWLVTAALALIHATAEQVHAKKLTRDEGRTLLVQSVKKLIA